MKTTIKKRFDHLEPGDVLPAVDGPALVVYNVLDNGPGACRDVRCMVTGTRGTIRSLTQASADMVEVEVVSNITPAQQHADELLAMVRELAAFKSPTSLEICRRAHALLDKIDPPKPPTLDEALSMLDEIMRRPGMTTPQGAIQERCDRADALLDRARRSGVLS